MSNDMPDGGTTAAASDFIGLFPAAGHARRLKQTASGSKEIQSVPELQGTGSIAVGDYLVREYQRAGIRDVVIIRRAVKRDIEQHYLHSSFSDLNFRQIITTPTASTAHTIDQARQLYARRPVALGFPDIIVHAPGVFKQLCHSLVALEQDICLALFPATAPAQSDMVAYTQNNLDNIEIKPARTDLQMTWSCAVWQPVFSRFLHRYLAAYTQRDEPYLGQIFLAAREQGLRIGVVPFAQALSLDIGTPEALARARSLRAPQSGPDPD